MKAWSLVTRITHWLIAVPVLLDFFVEGGDLAHEILGYVAFAATIFRIGWGVVTTDAAQFRFFPLGARALWGHGASLLSGKLVHYPGHNPMASWVYVAIWSLVLGLGVTGYMMGLDAFWGDEWLEELHGGMSNALMALVGLHFVGIGLDSWKYKRRTWWAMFSGDKS